MLRLLRRFLLESLVMHARSLMIAALAVSCAAAAAAEPPKTEGREANAQPSRSGPIVFASADQVQAPASVGQQQQEQAPAKPRRVGRVTTCRCADQIQH
jgi:hypothetical protein